MRFSSPGTTSALPFSMAFTALLATGSGPVPNFRARSSIAIMPARWVKPVMMLPGQTAVTVTGPFFSSIRNERDQTRTKDLLAAYTAKVAMGE